MKPSYLHKVFGILVAGAAVLVLALLMLNVTATAATPAVASQVEPIQFGQTATADKAGASPPVWLVALQQPITPTWGERRRPGRVSKPANAAKLPAAPGNLRISKSVTTGSDDNEVVYNGDRITYTLTIINNGVSTATGIILYDTLPDGLDKVQCADVCHKVVEPHLIPTPLGGFTVVSVTTELTWSIGSLAPDSPNNVAQRVFSARVVGQSDGAVIQNTADLEYDGGVAISNEAGTTVRICVKDEGRATLSGVPTWLSSDLGGTLGLDWGDFDHDGDLDLALGSAVGTTVYRNDQGRLTWFWGNDRYTLGVRWADLDGDGDLELVTVGDSVNHSAVSSGTNYVFGLGGTEFVTGTFQSDSQLLRVEPGDYDGDGDIDLIASTNAISVECPVCLYRNPGNGEFSAPFDECVSEEATANIAPGDPDNDGYLDLALGLFPNTTRLLLNRGVTSTTGSPFTSIMDVDKSTAFLPYDFAWGDFDRDGYLDLAAAFPLERKARIYRNDGGGGFEPGLEFPTSQFRTPEAVEWGDFDGDGYLDLVVADAPPRIYLNSGDKNGYSSKDFFSQARFIELPQEVAGGQIWATAAADEDNDGDLDLALGNWKGASLLLTTFAPFLDTRLTQEIGSWSASSVAWGDVAGDGYLDLLFGSGGRTANARLYRNQQGYFSLDVPLDSKYGPHSVALGHVDHDGQLDIALGAVWLQDRIYLSQDRPATGEWKFSYELSSSSYSLVWGDAEGDGDLDLLAGTDGPNVLYVNQGASLDTTPAWTSAQADDTRSLAWADYDNDGYPDFAAGNWGQRNRIYRNNGDYSFSLAWSSSFLSHTTSVAWGDYNGDGYLDLAMGNGGGGAKGERNLIYENAGGAFGQTPIWRSDALSKTTSLAWGDWDNDGDLDLAVGNDGESDQVYTNQGSAPGSPRLLWLWTSAEAYRTSGVAWGDRDSDGDLDLAISQAGGGQNGFYENNYVLPAHLTNPSTKAMPLPNNSSYLVITRPGTTTVAYFFSSAELLAYPSPPTLTVRYRLFDPDGAREGSDPDAPGDAIAGIRYQYSLDGGGTWHDAREGVGASSATTSTSCLGQEATFVWDARKDWAISDDARFRITIIHQNTVGPVQRASTSAISPPFRVRGTSCVWPMGPSFTMDPDPPQPGDEVTFEGSILEGEGPLTFSWDFGDGTGAQGQVVRHTYAIVGVCPVKMRVTSKPCPIARVVTATRTIMMGGVVYLPIIAKSIAADGAGSTTPTEALPMPEIGLWKGPVPNVEQAQPPETGPQPSAGGDQGPAGPMSVGSATSGGVFPPNVPTTTASISITITPAAGIHGQPSINADGSRIAFWSTGDLELEQCSQRQFVEIGPILVVDDDDNNPDVRDFYVNALNDLGATYDIWDTNNSDNEPDLAALSGYAGVIWFTGHEYGGYAGPGPASETALASFLDGGGFLFVSSQDYLWDRGQTGFMRDYLGLSSYANDARQASVAGTGSVFGVLGLYSLNYPFYNYSDRISPDGTAELAFKGNQGDAALNKETDVYRTTFWGFPFEAFPNDSARLEAMRATLLWLGFGCKLTAFNDDGNIEAFLAEVDAADGITITHVSASRGSILGGFNLWPSISADGNHIAFFSDWDLVAGGNEDQNFEIFMAKVGPSSKITPTQVTNTAEGANLWPSLGADGRRIAFASDRDLTGENGGGNQEIFLAEIAPGAEPTFTQVTSTSWPIVNDQPAISGDGKHIAFASDGELEPNSVNGDGNQEIFVAEVGPGGGITFSQVTSTSLPIINDQPSISADGRRIAFSSEGALDPNGVNDDGNREIFLAEIAPGTEPAFTQVTSTSWPLINDQPSISADGQRIAFVSGSKIWLYDDYGSPKAILLSRGGSSTSRPTISADGIHVAFAANHQIHRVFSPLTDLVISKHSSPDVFVPGRGITYTIAVTNNGLFDVAGAHVSDTIPAEIQPSSWTCQQSPGSSCTSSGLGDIHEVVTISHGSAITYMVSGTPGPSATGTLTNTAVVTAPASITDQDMSNNTQTVTDTLLPEADLVVHKSADRNPVVAGTTLTYTLVYTNDGGPSYAWDVTLSDTLPAGVAFGGIVQGSEPSSTTDRVLAWTTPTLEVGEAAEIVFTATVAPWILSDTITNTVVITSSSRDVNPGDNQEELTTTITTSADLVITKTANTDAVLAGRTLTYTLAYTNDGPSDAQKVTITDTLPVSVTWDGTVLDMDPPLFGPTQTADLHTWYWYTPTLWAGASGTITFAVTVSDRLAAPVSLTNLVTINSSTDDPEVGNNSDDETTEVVIPVDLKITKIAHPDPIDAGQDIVYTITVTNLSSITATNATVYDDVPTQVRNVTWTCRPSAGSTCTGSGTVGIDDEVTIAPGGMLTYTLDGKMNASAPSTVVNTAEVTLSPGFTDTNPLDNSDAFTSTVTTSADLEVSKSVDNARPNVGETIVYTLIVSNPVGPSEARHVVVTDTLPPGIEYLSHSSGKTYDETSGEWDVGRIRPGHSEQLDITANVSDTGVITITNVIEGLRADAYDPDETNNTDSVTVTVNYTPTLDDCTFSVNENSPNGTSVGTVTATDPNAGDTLTYTITAGNMGNAFAIGGSSGEITVRNSAALDYETNPTFSLTIEVEDSGGLADTAAVTITLNDLDESPAVTITAPSSGFASTEGASVTFTGTAIDPEDGDLSASLSWRSSIDDAIGSGASFSKSDLTVGTHVITATVTDSGANLGSDTVTITITDVLPDITVAKAADPTSLPEPGGTVTFTVVVTNNTTEAVTLTVLTDDQHGDLNGQGDCATGGAISGNGSYECIFTAAVTGDPDYSETDTVTVTVQDDENNTGDDDDSATVTITDVLPYITANKTAKPTNLLDPGGTVTFTVRVVNNTTEAVTLTVLTDDQHGDLNGQGDCATGGAISGNGSYGCTFTAIVTGDSGYSETDVVTATVRDDENNPARDDDSATVTVVPFNLTITGPDTGMINNTYTFTATVGPTATLPITYTWQATDRSSESHPAKNRLTDTMTYTWNVADTKVITVTATNVSGTVTSTHVVIINAKSGLMPGGWPAGSFGRTVIYLPLVLKGDWP